MASSISIKVEGLDKLQAALKRFPQETKSVLADAGKDVAEMILDNEGLRKYPPSGPANLPPAPFYIRGRDTQTTKRNLGNSQRLGSRWTVKVSGYKTTIGNSATYSPFVHGERQARAMASIGWRKIQDVAEENIDKITKKYNAWVDVLLKRVGLK